MRVELRLERGVGDEHAVQRFDVTLSSERRRCELSPSLETLVDRVCCSAQLAARRSTGRAREYV